MDDHATVVVQPTVRLQRRAHDDDRAQLRGLSRDPQHRRVHGVEEDVLEEEVLDGIPSQRQFGKTATATPSSWNRRTCSMIRSAFVAGSARATGSVHAATRAKPWR